MWFLVASLAVSFGLAPSLLLGEASYETIRSDLSHQLLSIDQPALPYRYKISLNPTTIQDWVTFLNCKAKYDDPHNLYKEGGDTERNLTDGVYRYSVASGVSGTNPVRQVTLYGCQRYVNWLENGANGLS